VVYCAVNILAVEQVEYSQRFATPAQNKFEGVDWLPGVRAELLRPILTELAGMPARGIARGLKRKVPLSGGGPWHAMTVIRVQRRLIRGRTGRPSNRNSEISL
jgi:hypothetical protein